MIISTAANDRTIRQSWVLLSDENRFINRHNPSETVNERALNEAYPDVELRGVEYGKNGQRLRCKAGTWLRTTVPENRAARVGFAPGLGPFFVDDKDKRRLFNLWTPPAFKPHNKPVSNSEIEPALRLIAALCHRDDSDGADALRKSLFLHRWIATQVQRPRQRADSYLLISGPQGCGKSTLAECLIGPMLGGRQDAVTSEQISGEFGDWAVNRRMVLVEEVKRRGDYTFANKIKPMITGDSFTVNPKGRTPFTIPNYMAFVMLSNFHDAVVLEDGDRRCFHVRAPDNIKEKLGPEFFKSFHAWYDMGGKEKWLRWLIDYQLTNALKPQPPLVGEKQALIKISEHPIRSEILDARASEHPMFREGVIFTYRMLVDYLKTTGAQNTLRDSKAVMPEAEAAGIIKLGRKTIKELGKPELYTAGSRVAAEKAWQEKGQKALYFEDEF